MPSWRNIAGNPIIFCHSTMVAVVMYKLKEGHCVGDVLPSMLYLGISCTNSKLLLRPLTDPRICHCMGEKERFSNLVFNSRILIMWLIWVMKIRSSEKINRLFPRKSPKEKRKIYPLKLLFIFFENWLTLLQ